MKKFLLILTGLLCTFTSWAETVRNVKYIDANGTEQTCEEATVVESLEGNATWVAGWYIVTGTDVIITDGATCTGDVHLILADGAKLTAVTRTYDEEDENDEPNNGYTGIYVGDKNTLTIYGQTNGTGQLIASGDKYCSGIGGKALSIVINGGTITAKGGSGASAIGNGGGNVDTEERDIYSITINGGTITATGGGGAPGIGSGYWGTAKLTILTINGGAITATGGYRAAGIGAGVNSTCHEIHINGGNITATGGDAPYGNVKTGIGPGCEGICSKVYINQDLATCVGSSQSTAKLISNDGENIVSSLSEQYTYVSSENILNVDYIDADGTTKTCETAKIVKSYDGNATWDAGWYVVQGTDVNITNGATCTGDVHLILADDAKLTASTTTTGYTGIYVGTDNTLTIYGQTNGTGQLIASGEKLCAGIGGQGEAIVINGGTITATGGNNGAGIGSGNQKVINTITINGGTITATGGVSGAAIGSGYGEDAKVKSITITGGNVTATGGSAAKGIGAGYSGTCESVIINKDIAVFAGESADQATHIANDGTNIASTLTQRYVSFNEQNITNVEYVDAEGNLQTCTEAVTIVDSYDGNATWPAGWYVVQGTDVKITNGATCTGDVHLILADGAKLTVSTTTSGYTGIYADNNTLTIYGQANGTGQLIATGGYCCAGIGGNKDGNIIINGGVITATGGDNGAGIGSASASGSIPKLKSITINRGTITATGGSNAAGIGTGIGTGTETYKSVVESITINGGNVTATGGYDAAGIGAGALGGECGSVIINKELAIFADATANPKTLFDNAGENIASTLTQQYVSIPGTKVLPSVTLNSKGFATYSAASNATIYNSDDVKAYTAKVNGTTITLNSIDDDILSGTGIVLYGTAGTKVVMLESTKENIATSESDLKPTTTSETACVDRSTVTGTVWVLGDGNQFLKYKEGLAFAANRGYLVHEPSTSGAKMTMVFAADDATGISQIENTDLNNDDSCYNLAGQKVNNDTKGIIIKNGHKYINK